jgi:hypothetical protein
MSPGGGNGGAAGAGSVVGVAHPTVAHVAALWLPLAFDLRCGPRRLLRPTADQCQQPRAGLTTAKEGLPVTGLQGKAAVRCWEGLGARGELPVQMSAPMPPPAQRRTPSHERPWLSSNSPANLLADRVWLLNMGCSSCSLTNTLREVQKLEPQCRHNHAAAAATATSAAAAATGGGTSLSNLKQHPCGCSRKIHCIRNWS